MFEFVGELGVIDHALAGVVATRLLKLAGGDEHNLLAQGQIVDVQFRHSLFLPGHSSGGGGGAAGKFDQEPGDATYCSAQRRGGARISSILSRRRKRSV